MCVSVRNRETHRRRNGITYLWGAEAASSRRAPSARRSPGGLQAREDPPAGVAAALFMPMNIDLFFLRFSYSGRYFRMSFVRGIVSGSILLEVDLGLLIWYVWEFPHHSAEKLVKWKGCKRIGLYLAGN